MGLTATASRVIKRYGEAAHIVRAGEQTGPAYNPTFGPDIEHACTAAITNYTTDERAGTLIAETDFKALVAIDGLSIEPTPADKLKVDGVSYAIGHVSPVGSKGSVHFWRLRVSQ